MKPPREEDPEDDRGDDDDDEVATTSAEAPGPAPSSESDVPTLGSVDTATAPTSLPLPSETPTEESRDEPAIQEELGGLIDLADVTDGGVDEGADAGSGTLESGNGSVVKPSQRPKRVITDYPGFEGMPLSHEKAVKLRFARQGSKEQVRMLRVQNRLKSGTHAVPITLDEERAAGVHANTDVLFIIAKAVDCITVAILLPRFFNIGAEKGLIRCSVAELRDSKTTIDGELLYGAENPTDYDELVQFDPNRPGAPVKDVPAICARELNPNIVANDIGQSVWQMKIDDVQILLDLHAADVASPFKLPVSRSGLPYRGSDDEVLFILSGSEDGQPDLSQLRVQQSERENATVACQFSHCCMEVNVKDMRHHVAAHLLYDAALSPGDLPAFPCGFCGVRGAVPYTTASTMVAGCTTGLRKGQHLGVCKLVGKPLKYSHKSALKSSPQAESTNVPIQCPHPQCNANKASFVYVYKYSMPKHYRLEHPGFEVPAGLCEIGDEEKGRLAKLWAIWAKILKNRPTRGGR